MNKEIVSKIKIVFEDEVLLVVEKPAGLVVNEVETVKREKTLQNWVDKKLQIASRRSQVADRKKIDNVVSISDPSASLRASERQAKSEEESDFLRRSGIVHRLDKETSGIILIAKDPQTFSDLQKQFKEGRVEKTYIALVHGKVVPEEGEIRVPVGRLPWNRMRFGILPGGRESKTQYKVSSIKYLVLNKKKEPLSLVEVYPKTGRTHQIRVHFQYIGHPVFADALYAGRKVSREDRRLLPRHFLHAAKISFTHPATGERVEFESSLPKELSEFLTKLE